MKKIHAKEIAVNASKSQLDLKGAKPLCDCVHAICICEGKPNKQSEQDIASHYPTKTLLVKNRRAR